MSSDLITLLREYADVAEAGDKPHWAKAMRQAVQRISALEAFVEFAERQYITPGNLAAKLYDVSSCARQLITTSVDPRT